MPPTVEQLQKALNPLSLQGLFYVAEDGTHLDLGSNDGRTLRGLDRSRLTCVELFGPSVAILSGNGFRQVWQEDIRTFTERAKSEGQQWDRVTAFDVIEHIPKPDGEKLLDEIELIAAREIVLFMPIETPALEATAKWQEFRETGLSLHPDGQRELHAHQSRWAPEDLAARGYITMTLGDFHFPGFGAFFAAKYRSQEDTDTVLARLHAFAASQNGPRIDRPVWVIGREHMDIHPSVSIGVGARLECITSYAGVQYQPHLGIGENTTAEMGLHLACAQSLVIGRDCILASNILIADHEHGYAVDRPLHGQPLTVAPVRIGDSVFVGEGVYIGPGVTIGDRAVIGAHSVVTHDVPVGAVVAGAPAKVLRLNTLATMDLQSEGPLVKVVIPTVDPDSERIKRCVDSIHRCTPAVDYWLHVVVDRNREGFARTCNRGIAQAMADGASYILLLNDDTKVWPGWLTRMLAVMDAHPDVGLVGPMSDYVSGNQQGEVQPGAAPEFTFRLVGFCTLLRRSLIEKVGGLDETFTDGHFTDDDLCLRAQAAGFRAAIARDSFVRHAGSQTFKALGIDYAASLAASWQQFAAKWGAQQVGDQGGYRVPRPEFSRERCFIPLPEVLA